MGEGREHLGWGSETCSAFKRKKRGGGEAGLVGWVSCRNTAQALRPPLSRVPSPQPGPGSRPLLVSLGLAGESGAQERSRQRPSPRTVGIQRVTGSSPAPLSMPALPLLLNPHGPTSASSEAGGRSLYGSFYPPALSLSPFPSAPGSQLGLPSGCSVTCPLVEPYPSGLGLVGSPAACGGPVAGSGTAGSV